MARHRRESAHLHSRCLPTPTRSTAVFVRPGLGDPMAAKPHCHRLPRPGMPSKTRKAMPMCIEQHLMRLQQISPNQKGAAVRQLDMRHLQLDAFSAHIGPVFAQSNWNASPGANTSGTKVPRSVVFCARCRSPFPIAEKLIPRINFWPGSYAQRPRRARRSRHIQPLSKLFKHVLRSAAVLTRLALVGHKPVCQPRRVWIDLARSIRCLKLGLDDPLPQIHLDPSAVGLEPMATNGFDPRYARPPCNLANGHLVPQRPLPNNPQKSHVYHSKSPRLLCAGARLHMGQFSMTISAVAGSVLSDNQH